MPLRFESDRTLPLVITHVKAAAESFFGLLKRERIYRRQYQTRHEARTDIFDYIERFHNPRKRRQLEMRQKQDLGLPNGPWKWDKTQSGRQPSK